MKRLIVKFENCLFEKINLEKLDCLMLIEFFYITRHKYLLLELKSTNKFVF